ncbi:MAG: S-layer homology domain-containing protein, partial [Oscillospiraceae bacterium]|nr:S-layer homology domain-containing protein [Oscillospiraceae bacterium]
IISQINSKLGTKSINRISFASNTATYGKLYEYDGTTVRPNYRYEEYEADEILFVPSSSATSKNTASFTAYVTTTGSGTRDFVFHITFNLIDGGTSSSGGNINYFAIKGDNVDLELADFESFWTDYQSRGSLTYITINSVSGGKLYTSDGKSVTSSDRLYVNPTTSQRDLGGLYFTPTSNSTSSGRVTFTAHGSRTGTGSSYDRSGSVAISFLSNSANTIRYSTNIGGAVSLNYNDFINAYKQATGSSSTPSNLSIEFQSVPSYGYLSYKTSSSSSSSTTLTNSTISGRKFNAKSSGNNRINDVTYTVTGSRSETVKYIAYIGNNPSFTGEITFNSNTAPTNVNVPMVCYSTAGAALSPASFTGANQAMMNATYISFGTPRTGRLTGASNNMVLVSMLGSVSYIPAATLTSTTDTFTFTAYDSASTVVASGTVSVTVSLPITPTTTTPGAAVQFKDVPSGIWYATQLNYLSSRGIFGGIGGGQFAPDRNLTWAEALKLVMKTAGYAQTEVNTPGVSWAQNYKNTAVNQGWISNSVDLSKNITRLEVAELTAKVLGIPASTNPNVFADVNNAYATALYEKRIMMGEGSNASGQPIFQSNPLLTRSQMAVIVYNVCFYLGK